jgi:hypothetical protein
MILFKYQPFSDPKIKEVEAVVEMPEHPEILTIRYGTYAVSGTIEALVGTDYFLTSREAIEARVATQKRVIEREIKLLAIAEKDLESY